MKDITLIAAVSENNVIGYRGTLPWRFFEDLRRFRNLTLGNTVVMGRKTFESIGVPLKRRENIVLTRREDYGREGIIVARNLDEAISLSSRDGIYIIGGESVYREAMPFANRMEITKIYSSYKGDTFFPEINLLDWDITKREDRGDFSFLSYERIK